MLSIWAARNYFCNFLVQLLGYFSPAINSAKAIVTEDRDGIREYLTYWTVLGILMFLETILSFSSAFLSWPPEIKVLFILWLTLPQFQGAFRIYTILVKPRFDQYEEEIDRQISVIGAEATKRAHRHFRTILWQLFLAPNDGLLTLTSSGLNTLLAGYGYNIPIIFLGTGDISQPAVVGPPTVLGKQLLDNFAALLSDGIYLDVDLDFQGIAENPGDDIGGFEFKAIKCTLQGTASTYLLLEDDPSSAEESLTSVTKRISYVDSKTDTADVADADATVGVAGRCSDSRRLFVPVYQIVSVTSGEDPTTLIVSVPRNSIVELDANSISVDQALGISASASAQHLMQLVLREEDADACEALLAGLTILTADVRRRVKFTLSRALKVFSSHTGQLLSLRAAFLRWRSGGTATAAKGRSSG